MVYDLFLTRTPKHAQLECTETSASAMDLFQMLGLDAAAGVNPMVRDLLKTLYSDPQFIQALK